MTGLHWAHGNRDRVPSESIPIRLISLPNLFNLQYVEQIHRLWILFNHFTLLILLLNDRYGLKGFLTFLHSIAVSVPLIEREAVRFRIVAVCFSFAPTSDDLLFHRFSGTI